ncbi:MAG: hypothetical protein PHH91_03715 [Desulfuromonadaceae bacterium]|nr:hypothetical protein [Desulfuromonadaceae bacterium]
MKYNPQNVPCQQMYLLVLKQHVMLFNSLGQLVGLFLMVVWRGLEAGVTGELATL